MAAIQIKRVPEGLHNAVRVRAAEEGMSVTDYVIDVLRRDLALPSQRAWLAELETRTSIEVDAAAAVHAARDEREADLDRAHRR
jgi:plasmid stability protein